MTQNLVKLNLNQNQPEVETGYFNFTASNIFGQPKRFRKIADGGWYIDLVAAAGRKIQTENARRDYLSYSSLKIVDKNALALLNAVDQHTNGALSQSGREDNHARIIVNIGDLAVRGYQLANRDKLSSSAVGTLLSIAHLQVGKDVFTQDSNGNATNAVEILNAQKALLNPEEFLNPQEFDTYQAHAFTGIGFINHINFYGENEKKLKLTIMFSHGKKDNPRRTRAFVYVSRDTEIASILEREYGDYPKARQEDGTIFGYNIPQEKPCFFAGMVNVFSKSVKAYEFTNKEGEKIEGIASAIEANLLKVTNLSINKVTMYSSKADEVLQDVNQKSQQASA